jgi:uncharacterized membrane protein YkoI
MGLGSFHIQEEEMRSNRNAVAASVIAAFFALPAMATQVEAKRPMDLAQAIDLVAKTYPGRVVAGQADAIGGDRMHFHVDIVLVNGNIAKFDVDGVTQRIYNRLPPEDSAAAGLSLGEAIRKVQGKTGGRVVSAEYDPDPAPHYHVAVRTPQGKLARLDVDAATGESRTHKPRT